MVIKDNDGDYLVQEKPREVDAKFKGAKPRYRVTWKKAYATCFTRERAEEVLAIISKLIPSRRWKAVN